MAAASSSQISRASISGLYDANGNPAALARVHEIVVAEHNSRVK